MCRVGLAGEQTLNRSSGQFSSCNVIDAAAVVAVVREDCLGLEGTCNSTATARRVHAVRRVRACIQGRRQASAARPYVCRVVAPTVHLLSRLQSLVGACVAAALEWYVNRSCCPITKQGYFISISISIFAKIHPLTAAVTAIALHETKKT